MTLITAERYEVQGSLEEVESTILAASRGIMRLAWLTERASGAAVGINPACIVSLRAVMAARNSPPSRI